MEFQFSIFVVILFFPISPLLLEFLIKFKFVIEIFDFVDSRNTDDPQGRCIVQDRPCPDILLQPLFWNNINSFTWGKKFVHVLRMSSMYIGCK